MSKYGVGVGDEFPVDQHGQVAHGRAEPSECCGGWQQFRHHMHDEWSARRRAMKDAWHRRQAMQHAARDFGERHLYHLIIGAIAVVGLAALVVYLRDRD